MSTQLFQPMTIGPVKLQHRVVLAPLTRMKSDPATYVPFLPLVKDYYTQRGSMPGTLLIAEATNIAAKAGGIPSMPGIWSPAQIKAWNEVVTSVHAQGSFIFSQIVAMGRVAIPAVLKADDPTFSFVSASDIPIVEGDERPRPLTISEIQEYVGLYAQAATNAMEAGFDGVEIHGTNGCLVDQFLQDVSNNRTDIYGGTVENRGRFTLEVVKAVTDAIGESNTAIRLSPWNPSAGMGMDDPIPTFSYVVSEIKHLYPKLAYLHLIEPRIASDLNVEVCPDNVTQSNDFLRKIWGDRPLISAGGFNRETAIQLADHHTNALVAFGRHFIANPDLPRRLEKNISLHPYDRSTFYLPGQDSPRGYTDQPFPTEPKP